VSFAKFLSPQNSCLVSRLEIHIKIRLLKRNTIAPIGTCCLSFLCSFLSLSTPVDTSIHFIKRRGLSKYRVDQVHCNSFNFLWLVHYRFYLEIFLFSLLCRKLTTWTGPRWHWVSPCFYVYQGKVGKQSLKEKQTTSPSDLCTWYVVITSWFCLNVSCMYNYQGDLCF
jgi:hypothetical protein